jgi:hypothetical protein
MDGIDAYTKDEWAQYAAKLTEYATGDFKGDAGISDSLNYGTCRYCSDSEPELSIHAYRMFELLREHSEVARRLNRLYTEHRVYGRIPERIQLAGELASFICERIVK